MVPKSAEDTTSCSCVIIFGIINLIQVLQRLLHTYILALPSVVKTWNVDLILTEVV